MPKKKESKTDFKVDWKEVKAQVSMEMVLDRFGLKLRRVNATALRGKCPLPTHSADSTSAESFNVSSSKNAWACQSKSCVAARNGRKGGNVLDLVALMQNCSVKEAAELLHDSWFPHLFTGGVGEREKSSVAARAPRELAAEKKAAVTVSDNDKRQAADTSNMPLKFTLQGIDATHPYFAKRGILRETVEHFGVGFFGGKGMMSGRVVIPIHNEAGQLVAYAGRWPGDSGWPELEGKYKLPPGFKKTLELFNLHRAVKATSHPVLARAGVIVVEGFFDVMKVH